MAKEAAGNSEGVPVSDLKLDMPYEFTGVFIPASVWLHPELNCTERCLLAEIGALGGHRGKCTAGNEYLGKHVGVGADRVSRMVNHLIELGMVEVVAFTGRSRVLRSLYDTKADLVKTPMQPSQKSQCSPGENTNAESSPYIERGIKSKELRNKEEASPEVIAIYQAYPLKVARKKAQKAIIKALDKITAEELLKKTKAFSAARNGDLSFCPHPATWFNDERFNDDPETWKPFEKRFPAAAAQSKEPKQLQEDFGPDRLLYKLPKVV